jgi:mono/diheme cytochrome c family protein
MRKEIVAICFVGFIAMLISCGKEKNPFEKKPGSENNTTEGVQPKDNSQDKKVFSGGELYSTKCTACHGNDGNLGIGGAKKISESTLTQQEREELISNGKKTMPAFKEQLSSEEIKAIAEYTFTLK